MATIFLEPGGDADFGTGLWDKVQNGPVVATDFVTHGHIKSISYAKNGSPSYVLKSNAVVDAGGRTSVWVYFNALPSAAANTTFLGIEQASDGAGVVRLRILDTGAIQLFEVTNQLGSNGMILATGVWYRISFAWVITSKTVNDFRVWVNGVLTISVTNATLTNNLTADWFIGNASGNVSADMRSCDHYIDNSSALTDPGNILITAKRPNANGTTNGYTTQIGAGGSGYGTGHSPQVNERPNSDTNGWSVVTVASAITEEYNIESKNQGDVDITNSTIVDYMGWVRTKALNAETAQIVINNVNSSISVTTSILFFTKIAGSATYPAGTGKDIGEISAASATTISLYECGIIFAYTPIAPTAFASWAARSIGQPYIANDVQPY